MAWIQVILRTNMGLPTLSKSEPLSAYSLFAINSYADEAQKYCTGTCYNEVFSEPTCVPSLIEPEGCNFLRIFPSTFLSFSKYI